MIDHQPFVRETRLGNDSITTFIDPEYIDEGWQTTDKSTVSSTNYVYGIGWHVNDNLQIDLMHFDEITRLTNWKLSATLRFD